MDFIFTSQLPRSNGVVVFRNFTVLHKKWKSKKTAMWRSIVSGVGSF